MTPLLFLITSLDGMFSFGTVPTGSWAVIDTSSRTIPAYAYGTSSRPGSGTETIIMLTPDHEPLKRFLGSTYNYMVYGRPVCT
ncbi:hypothetical protein BJV78DRAFT_89763 [Lactifluus subvellereus]|nr:hypothetical protein BJV78DRAFT_89763 [Lactifluus subvellereus]